MFRRRPLGIPSGKPMDGAFQPSLGHLIGLTHSENNNIVKEYKNNIFNMHTSKIFTHHITY